MEGVRWIYVAMPMNGRKRTYARIRGGAVQRWTHISWQIRSLRCVATWSIFPRLAARASSRPLVNLRLAQLESWHCEAAKSSHSTFVVSQWILRWLLWPLQKPILPLLLVLAYSLINLTSTFFSVHRFPSISLFFHFPPLSWESERARWWLTPFPKPTTWRSGTARSKLKSS